MSAFRVARMRVCAALILTLPLLAGCVVGPDYERPSLLMPAKWSGARMAPSKPADLARWWTKLNDRLLDELIDEAVAGNLDVAAAKARVREARATLRQTSGTLLPSASGSGAATRNQSAAASSGSTDTYSQFQAGFDASWEIDLFGGKRRSIEAARYGVASAQEDLRNTLLTLIGDVATNYAEARGYQARIALARRTAASQRETAALTRTKLQLGAASDLDVANATGQAASTEADIPTLETAYAEAVNRLAILTGRAPGAVSERLKATGKVPAPRLPLPAGVPADILLSRPDVRQAESQLAQATAKIGAAEADRYPSVSLTGDIATTGTRIGDLGKSSTISWSFGPTLTVPIFNGGQLAAAADVARAQRDQYFVAYKAAVLTALEDVENAMVGLAQERVRVGKLAASASSYQRAADLSRNLYREGSLSFLDVLTADRSAYSATSSLIQSRVTLATYYIALNKALGGGWDGAVDTDTPAVVDSRNGPRLASVR